jgi:hypothetical protein
MGTVPKEVSLSIDDIYNCQNTFKSSDLELTMIQEKQKIALEKIELLVASSKYPGEHNRKYTQSIHQFIENWEKQFNPKIPRLRLWKISSLDSCKLGEKEYTSVIKHCQKKNEGSHEWITKKIRFKKIYKKCQII